MYNPFGLFSVWWQLDVYLSVKKAEVWKMSSQKNEIKLLKAKFF